MKKRPFDLKEQYQLKAEELAEERYGMDFYELGDARQYEIYTEAEVLVHERLKGEAERIHDRMEGR